MRIYIAGPMTGLPQFNFPAFNAEAARLRAMGHQVVNPAEINAGREGEGWAACIRRDVAQLLTCDAIRMLPRYEWSRGARLELYIATALDFEIFRPERDVAPME
jgi:hypothetical protein